MLKRKVLYNELFIDHGKRRKHDMKNAEFWDCMNNLAMQYPEIDILVERFVKEHPFADLCEDVHFVCASQSVLHLAEQIYKAHYYVVPLYIEISEGEDKDAILQGLMHTK